MFGQADKAYMNFYKRCVVVAATRVSLRVISGWILTPAAVGRNGFLSK